MERIQFYPPERLKELLYADAPSKGKSVSALVIQILQEHYNATPKPEMTLAEAIPKVMDEVKAYIKTKAPGEKFDLWTASQTFRDINMIVEGKPSANRATVGKVFGGKLGTEPFENVEVSYTEIGKRELSPNRATMYIIKKENAI